MRTLYYTFKKDFLMSQSLVIVGGGTGGISIMRALRRKGIFSKITIIEPSENHFYQPLWTLVGGGIFPIEKSSKPTKKLIPNDVEWIQDKVKSFQPNNNSLTTESNQVISYDYLVVAAGIQIDWDKIEGLPETLGKNGVASNYSKDTTSIVWENIRNLKKGTALFTHPATPIKCAGAPQKIMYLAEDWYQKQNLRNEINVEFVSAGGAIFGVKKYRDALEKIISKRKINTTFQNDLIAIDGKNKVATFKNMETGETTEKHFDIIHVTPPMSAPNFIKNSSLANDAGWVDVDKHTLQHVKYPNIFAIGDCSSTPNSKTGAAIRRQGPVLIQNLIAQNSGKELKAQYNGYASCPLLTKRGGCILAEFNYSGEPEETFPFNQAEERWSMYMLKKEIIPFMYWNAMMKGFF